MMPAPAWRRSLAWARWPSCLTPASSSRLSFNASTPRGAKPHRRAAVQLNLNFPQLPLPHEEVWAQLSDADRVAALQALAELIAKAALDVEQEANDD
jgi:hypothetical protein